MFDSPKWVYRELRSTQTEVRERLGAFRWRLGWHLVAEGAAWLLASATLIAALTLWADWAWRLALPTRWTWGALGLLVLFFIAIRRLVLPLRKRRGDLEVAHLLEHRWPGTTQRVASILQLPDLLVSKAQPSATMVRAAVTRDAEWFKERDLNQALNRERLGWCIAIMVIAFYIPLQFALSYPHVARLWAKRWLMGSDIRWPQRAYLALEGLADDGNLYAPRAEPVMLQVDTNPPFAATANTWRLSGRPVILEIDSANPPQPQPPEVVQLRFRPEGGQDTFASFERVDETHFRYELPSIQNRVTLHIHADDDHMEPVTVIPIDRPAMKELVLTAKFVGQSEPKVYDLHLGNPQLSFLPKTELSLRLVATVPVSSAILTVAQGQAPTMVRENDTTYTASWTMREAQTLEIGLVGRDTRLQSRPFFLPIALLKDREPRLNVRVAGLGRRISPMARIPLTLDAIDDFGLTKLLWEMETTVAKVTGLEKKKRANPVAGVAPDAQGLLGTEIRVQSEIAVRDEGLPPGTQLRLRAVGEDNCTQGKQTGYSRWVGFQIVSADELFYEILMRQRAERVRFRGALETQQANLEALANNVTVEQAAATLRKHQTSTRHVGQVSTRLAATLVELTLNDLGTTQARALLETKILTPLRDLHANALDRQQNVLEKLVNGPTSASLTEARKAQADIVKKMERILEQMAQWESFVDVVNQLRDVMELQNKVLQGTERSRKDRATNVFDD